MNEEQQASLTWRLTPDLMCILDRDGRFVAVNPAWMEKLGWARADMVGEPFLKFLHPDDIARSQAAFEILVSDTPVLRFENRYRTRSGDHRWLQWVAIPESGSYFCTARDVTDDKQRDDRLADHEAEAELREQFIAVLGHDLRNPLSAIGAGAHLLLGQVQDQKSIEILRQMQSSVVRMSELINNLMDLARVRLGSGIGIERTTTPSLAGNLERVIEEIRLVSPETRIEATMEIAGAVTCDVARIMQLASNLLANAVLHGAPTEPVQLHAQTREGRLTISVSNKGKPIPEAIRAKLFQPFFRGEARASKQGLGLGLYIAAEIARAHDGTLAVASTEQETRFTLDIPQN